MDLKDDSSQHDSSLTEAQKDRIRKGKERALKIRQSRLTAHPYNSGDVVSIDKTTIKIGATKYKDTGGGFLLEEESENKDEEVPIVEDTPPIIESDRPACESCNEAISKSWLFDTFDVKVCDNCKDPETHKLITKTEAINEYLLKECDFDKRDPPLKFISKKNPHNVRWGEMKLYLKLQVEKRALEVWGSMEKIEEELERREEMRILNKTKKYNKKMKELRMNVRSSLFDRTTAASHTHEFGVDTYNSDDDTYNHECLICGYEETFEKM
ncbi:XPA protein C-terminus [Popillia japonica]|uniref:XPA protein C-terminus n=1 Tax=Popillia japonica TaxID=7064 RepID=A0AAW1KS17_POPJA